MHMKRFLQFILIISLSVTYAQEYTQKIENVIVWQANAKSGGKFIGVAQDAYEASVAIDEVKFIMEGTKYHILQSEINEISVLLDQDVTFEDDFISDDEYLEYKYISKIELVALEYMEKNDIHSAISFYTSVCKEKNKEKVNKYLSKLKSGYSKYLYERETPASLVTFSE